MSWSRRTRVATTRWCHGYASRRQRRAPAVSAGARVSAAPAFSRSGRVHAGSPDGGVSVAAGALPPGRPARDPGSGPRSTLERASEGHRGSAPRASVSNLPSSRGSASERPQPAVGELRGGYSRLPCHRPRHATQPGQRVGDLCVDALHVETDEMPQVRDRSRGPRSAPRGCRCAAPAPTGDAGSVHALRFAAARGRRCRSRPGRALSSSVTTSRLPRAASTIRSRSRGLAHTRVDDAHRPALGRQTVGHREAALDDGPEADEQRCHRPRAAPRPGRPGPAPGSTAGRSKPASRG